MTKRAIYITENDLRRLLPLLASARSYERADHEALDLLQEELDRAILCSPEDLPEGVVSMNARVTVTDLETGKNLEYTIVFPRDADYEMKRISVLAPIGTALLGYRVGAQVEWPTPGGMRRFYVQNVNPPVTRKALAKIA